MTTAFDIARQMPIAFNYVRKHQSNMHIYTYAKGFINRAPLFRRAMYWFVVPGACGYPKYDWPQLFYGRKAA